MLNKIQTSGQQNCFIKHIVICYLQFLVHFQVTDPCVSFAAHQTFIGLCGVCYGFSISQYLFLRFCFFLSGQYNLYFNCGLFRNIVNIDTSAVAIKQMKAKHKGKNGLEYHKMDATKTSFADKLFNTVLDKGTLDALMPDTSPETLQKITKLFDVRVLFKQDIF